jgi:leucyl aminopeptidase
MRIFTEANAKERPQADLLIVPFIREKGVPKLLSPETLPLSCSAVIRSGDFKANQGEVLLHHTNDKHEPRILFLGLGEPETITVESLRRAFSSAAKWAIRYKLKTVNAIVPQISSFSGDEVLRGVSEGIFLSNYAFEQLKKESIKENSFVPLENITFITPLKNALPFLQKTYMICQAVNYARDLVNGNADDVTPQYLASKVLEMAKTSPKIKTQIYDKKRLEKEKFGLILAVSRGSVCEPKLIIAEYRGNPKSKDITAIVGKGVTFDTGGLNLKGTGFMESMKCDMGGAAVALGVLFAASKMNLKLNIAIVVPATENAIGPASYKPGDVYTSYSGKTVEIGNTDAEGRLILADALAYTVKNLKPSRIIDVATLTGAIEIALGNELTGLFSNNDALSDSLVRAGSVTFERVWRMPLFEEYRDQLRSDVADIRNHGGRPGGSVTAAVFLKEFVQNTPWAHLDIAGTAYLNDARRYHPKLGTGIGVRLLIEFLESL